MTSNNDSSSTVPSISNGTDESGGPISTENSMGDGGFPRLLAVVQYLFGAGIAIVGGLWPVVWTTRLWPSGRFVVILSLPICFAGYLMTGKIHEQITTEGE